MSHGPYEWKGWLTRQWEWEQFWQQTEPESGFVRGLVELSQLIHGSAKPVADNEQDALADVERIDDAVAAGLIEVDEANRLIQETMGWPI